MRYVIIGSSAAGVSAAETLRRVDPKSLVTMISEEVGPIYSRCLLPRFIVGEISEKSIAFKSDDFFTKFSIQPYLGERVEAIKTAFQEVHLSSGKKIPYDRLLLACGASPSFPPIKGTDQTGVFALRTLKDAYSLIGAIKGTKKAVVIGGGLIGLEVAKVLKQTGINVAVIEITSHLLPQQLDSLAAGLVQQRFEQAGVELILGRTVQEIKGSSKRVKGVHLDNGKQIECQLVIIATGIKPNIDLALEANILVNRGILVNDYLETNLGDRVYAAGDVVETMDLLTGSTSLSPFWPNAVCQGRVAAMNMAGKRVKYPGTIAMQGTAELYNLPLVSYGLLPSACKDLDMVTSYIYGQGIYKKLCLDKGIPKGMIMVGDIKKAGLVAALIRKKTDLSEIKDRIWEANFSYAHFLKERSLDFKNYLRGVA